MDDGGYQSVFSSAVCIQQSYVNFLNVHIYIILEFSFFVTT